MTSSSHRTYKAAEKKYLDFCVKFSLTPFPLRESLLCYYVACIGQQGLAHNTIKTYLSGLRQSQITLGLPEPHLGDMPRLQQIIRGVQVERGKAGRTPRPRLPITPSILRRLKAVWEGKGVGWEVTMLWAASTFTFFSFCRSGEVTVPSPSGFDPTIHLSYSDISVDNPKSPSVLIVKLEKSKTDPFRIGVNIAVGSTQNDLCPVSAMLAYLAIRGSRDGPLFTWQNGTPLTRIQFVESVREGLSKANLPAKDFAGHSFRIGAATTAATLGMEDSLIQTLGRWKSSAYLLYVKLDPRQLASISENLSKAQL